MITDQRVRIVNGDKVDNYPDYGLAVLVDGEPLRGVTKVGIDWGPPDGPVAVQVTLLGVDIDFEAAPDYFVKVVGPRPQPGKG